MAGIDFDLKDVRREDFLSAYSPNTTNHTRQQFFEPPHSPTFYIGIGFYARVTPFLFVIGIFGNTLALVVFLRRNMRNLSASNYLAALAFTDLLSLVTFVLVEWLRDGLPYLRETADSASLDMQYLCQAWLYMSYVCRFVSAWIVIIFTFERYIAVCFPLRRRDLCTVRGSRNAIAALVIVTLLVMSYKPALSGWRQTFDNSDSQSNSISHYNIAYNNPAESQTIIATNHTRYACMAMKEYTHISHILDIIYGFSITLLPFVVITGFNLLIIRKLVITNRRTRNNRIRSEENLIKLEFTVILIVISVCFIVFNLPYFALWLHQYLLPRTSRSITHYDTIKGLRFIARTIFSLNYCVNFFLYSFTGAYFRREVQKIFWCCCKKSRGHEVNRQASRSTWV